MKAYGFQLEPYLINYNSCIRSKSDIIKMLIGIVRYLNMVTPVELKDLAIQSKLDEVVLILYIDKMSRVFISENNKIHTFQFPFALIISGEKAIIDYNGIEISSSILSVLTATFNELYDWQSIEQIIVNYWDVIRDLDVSTYDAQIYSGLITFLLSFEPGYLRFDHDEENIQNGHPLNHLDINYSNKNTFKVGLQNKLNHIQLIDILDISTMCLTLKY